jgi:hypothetical protein
VEVNRPDILAAVEALFGRYEAALVANDVAVLDELFWDSPSTVRFGCRRDPVSAEFRRTASGTTGRQQQTWMRTDGGWRIVAAHVSYTGS